MEFDNDSGKLFKDRESYLGKKVTIGAGFAVSEIQRHLVFIVVNDGSYFEPLQIVYHDEMENFAEVSKLNVGDCDYCERNACRYSAGKTAV